MLWMHTPQIKKSFDALQILSPRAFKIVTQFSHSWRHQSEAWIHKYMFSDLFYYLLVYQWIFSHDSKVGRKQVNDSLGLKKGGMWPVATHSSFPLPDFCLIVALLLSAHFQNILNRMYPNFLSNLVSSLPINWKTNQSSV